MKRLLIILLTLLPITSNAMTSDKLYAACKAENPGCKAYTLGGADRYWLVRNKHVNCDSASDKKTMETLKAAIKGEPNLYISKTVQPAEQLLLSHLSKNKLESCALTSNFADLTALCVSKEEAEQTSCHAYIAGVVDVAVAMDKQNQQAKKGKGYKTPFCEKGKPKLQLSDAEIMKAISDYGQTPAAANEAGAPAAQVVMQAILTKYSCKNQAKTAVTPIPAKAAAPKQPAKAEKK